MKSKSVYWRGVHVMWVEGTHASISFRRACLMYWIAKHLRGVKGGIADYTLGPFSLYRDRRGEMP